MVSAPARTRRLSRFKTRPGGSSELGRISEHLEEIPPLLARPSPAKSCDGFRMMGVPTWGVSGASRGPRMAKTAQVFAGNQFKPVRHRGATRLRARERSHLPRQSFQTRLTRPYPLISKGHFPVLYTSYPSVGEPVCRVSDEEVFWASMAARPRAARQPVRAKNRRSRGWQQTRKTLKVIVKTGRNEISTLPLVWRG